MDYNNKRSHESVVKAAHAIALQVLSLPESDRKLTMRSLKNSNPDVYIEVIHSLGQISRAATPSFR